MREREPRASVGVAVGYEGDGRQAFSPALNLSVSGVFLATPDPLPVGGEVQLVLSLPPDGVFLRIQGRVVRHAGPTEPRGFAVAFSRIDTRSRAELRAFVHSVGRVRSPARRPAGLARTERL
ncbi:MAG: PilZ domain-containing protein [Myxococcota bacterium]